MNRAVAMNKLKLTSIKRGVSYEKVLYVKNIPIEINNSLIYEIFSKYGKIVDYAEYFEPNSITSFKPTFKSMLIHFKWLKKGYQGQSIQINCQGLSLVATVIHGKVNNKNGLFKVHKVYIGNLPTKQAVSMLDLAKLFLSYGLISYLYPVLHSSSSICQGYGFVGFLKKETAIKAVKKCRNLKIRGFERIFCDFKKIEYNAENKREEKPFHSKTIFSNSKAILKHDALTQSLLFPTSKNPSDHKNKHSINETWNNGFHYIDIKCRFGPRIRYLNHEDDNLNEIRNKFPNMILNKENSILC